MAADDKQKTYKRGDYKTWAGYAKQLGLPLAKFAAECGFSEGTHPEWEVTGPPLSAVLAGEALVRRQGQAVRHAPAYVKLEVLAGQVSVTPLEIEEVTILGSVYKVIKE